MFTIAPFDQTDSISSRPFPWNAGESGSAADTAVPGSMALPIVSGQSCLYGPKHIKAASDEIGASHSWYKPARKGSNRLAHSRDPHFHSSQPVPSFAAMNSTDIQSKIQAAAARFTDEIVAVFGEAFASVASELTAKVPAKAKPARATNAAAKKAPVKKVAPAKTKALAPKPAPKAAKPAPKVSAPKKEEPGKRIRRSNEQLLADAQRVVKLLAFNKKGLRIEQINEQLGTATKQLARPITKLLAEGTIKKTGEKRATLYFPV
jgi:hypothetical protein